LNGIMGDGREMSQRTKLGLALGNREGQVWSGKKIVIPKDESGRRRIHRKGSVLYHLIDIGDDPTGPRPSTRTAVTQSDVEAEDRTPLPNNTVPSMNGQRYRIGDWVQTTLVPEAVRVLARSVHSDEYECGIGVIESFNQNCEHVPLGLVGGILPAKDPAFSLSHQPVERCGIHLLSGISHCSSIESRLQPDRHRIS